MRQRVVRLMPSCRAAALWLPLWLSMARLTMSDSISSSVRSRSKAYPVGCFFYSSVNVNPVTLFGFGTWAKVRGRFLFAEDGTIAAGSTGGEKSHTLTAAEMPSVVYF